MFRKRKAALKLAFAITIITFAVFKITYTVFIITFAVFVLAYYNFYSIWRKARFYQVFREDHNFYSIYYNLTWFVGYVIYE